MELLIKPVLPRRDRSRINRSIIIEFLKIDIDICAARLHSDDKLTFSLSTMICVQRFLGHNLESYSQRMIICSTLLKLYSVRYSLLMIVQRYFAEQNLFLAIIQPWYPLWASQHREKYRTFYRPRTIMSWPSWNWRKFSYWVSRNRYRYSCRKALLERQIYFQSFDDDLCATLSRSLAGTAWTWSRHNYRQRTLCSALQKPYSTKCSLAIIVQGYFAAWNLLLAIIQSWDSPWTTVNPEKRFCLIDRWHLNDWIASRIIHEYATLHTTYIGK